MPWFQYGPLHWGEIEQNITITDPDTETGEVKAIDRGATVKKISRRGRVDGVGGSGSVKPVGGSK